MMKKHTNCKACKNGYFFVWDIHRSTGREIQVKEDCIYCLQLWLDSFIQSLEHKAGIVNHILQLAYPNVKLYDLNEVNYPDALTKLHRKDIKMLIRLYNIPTE